MSIITVFASGDASNSHWANFRAAAIQHSGYRDVSILSESVGLHVAGIKFTNFRRIIH